MKDISVFELKNKMDSSDDYVLIDVREPFEYEMFNLNGKLIPLGNLPEHIEDLEAYKEKEVIVHCRSGARSATARDILAQKGFKNVRNLVGGVLAWQENHVNP